LLTLNANILELSSNPISGDPKVATNDPSSAATYAVAANEGLSAVTLGLPLMTIAKIKIKKYKGH
jgi:hypothetical protein